MTPAVPVAQHPPPPPRARRRNRNGENWSEIFERVHSDFPSTVDVGGPDSWLFTCKDEVIFTLVADLIKQPNGAGQRQHRELPSVEEGRQLIRVFFSKEGEDYSVEPFPEAFAALCVFHSVNEVVRRSGLNRRKVYRLRVGGQAPTMEDIEAIAEGFHRDPRYFAEYRALIITKSIYELMRRNPDRSAVIAHTVMSRAEDE